MALDICTEILGKEPGHGEALYLSALSRIRMGDKAAGGTELLKVMGLFHEKKLYGDYYENLKIADMLPDGRKQFEEWAERDPDDFSVHYYLGLICLDTHDYAAAAAAFLKALDINSSHAPTLAGLAIVRNEEQLFHEVEMLLRKAVELSPNCCNYLNNLAGAFKSQGLGDVAEEYYKKALAASPGNSGIHSNRLINLLCTLKPTREEIFSAHRDWERKCASVFSGSLMPHGNNPDPDRRLHIGYVSADFRRHPVAFFILPILLAHDSRNFDIRIYSNVARQDFITDQFRALGHHWTDISRESDESVCDAIRRDCIDILVDLGGHTSNNRLLLFARKPAPVQVSWLGYANTTGLGTIDYRITDGIADPPGATERFHTEKLFRLPGSFICYSAPQNPPPVGPLPAKDSGTVTFGAFNNFAKTNEKVFFLWAEILKITPGSRLLLKVSGIRHAPLRDRVLNAFACFGIGPDRIILHERKSHILEHLDLFNQVDIALDTFPYNGTTTTCEALFMGTPVITLAGNAHVSRVGASLLCHAGFPEFVADSEDEYVSKAAELAMNIERIDGYRSILRDRMFQSPLMDIEGFTRTLEAAYHRMWRNWTESGGPGQNP